MTGYVTEDECNRIKRLNEEGLGQGEICEQVGRARSTVRRHVRGACRHNGLPGMGRRVSPKIHEIKTAVRELAADIEKIPSRTDWDAWDKRPWSSLTVRNTIDGDWSDVIALAGLPTVAPNTPPKIREVAYKRPELTRMPDGGDESHA